MTLKSQPSVDPPFASEAVAAVFANFPEDARSGLLRLRRLIFEVAGSEPDVGRVEEALRWGQPAYLSASGSTIRLGVPASGGFALYAHCRTTIIPAFREMFPDDFGYEKNRAVLFGSVSDVQPEKLGLLVRHALTYHLKKAR